MVIVIWVCTMPVEHLVDLEDIGTEVVAEEFVACHQHQRGSCEKYARPVPIPSKQRTRRFGAIDGRSPIVVFTLTCENSLYKPMIWNPMKDWHVTINTKVSPNWESFRRHDRCLMD